MENNQISKRDVQLPAKLEDLTKFVIVGREKLTAVRAEIRAIDKLSLAQDVKEQKTEEAQSLAEALLDAETRIGELLPSTSQRSEAGTFEKTLPEGISWNQSSAYQKMAEHQDIVEEVKAEAREQDDLPTRTEVIRRIKLLDKPHVAQNSGNNEWYTPKEYIEAARKVLGVIDLDPASTILANTVVKAEQIYTIEDDGLAQEWIGNVWLNPPYAGDLVIQFTDKLTEEVRLGNTTEAIVLVNNATETRWFLTLIKLSSAICFPTGRVRFWGIDGNVGAPLQGQALVYIGNEADNFCREFSPFGWVVRYERETSI